MKRFEGGRWDGKKLLVCAKEAGAGACLASLLREENGFHSAVVYASPLARAAFRQAGTPRKLIVRSRDLDACDASALMESENPDVVVVGASVGWSLEKRLLLEAKRRGVPVVAYVDHFWNLWQRFAHPKTAKRWYFLPDRIYVLNRGLKARMIKLGCPARQVHVWPHPLLAELAERKRSGMGMSLKKKLRIAKDSRIALFVSEYGYRNSKKWRWEQPTQKDFAALLSRLLRAVSAIRKASGPAWVVLIKLHPVQGRDVWKPILRKFDPAIYRVVRDADKLSLLDGADRVFGLNSMLLLEALCRKRKVFSMHAVRQGRPAWLSTIEPRITELRSSRELLTVLTGSRPPL